MSGINCERCDARCRIAPKPGSKARMLKRGKGAGLCVNCATHDFLRHTYPANLQLAASGPKVLLNPDIRELFADIMRTAGADAEPDEINWNLIVENWELPWRHSMKSSGTNQVTEAEVERARREGFRPYRHQGTITKPLKTVYYGLDELKADHPDLARLIEGIQRRGDQPSLPDRDDPPPTQGMLFR